MGEEMKPKQFLEARPEGKRLKRKTEKELREWNRRYWEKEGKTLKRDEEGCCRPRKVEGVRRGPHNSVRHHREDKEEDGCLLGCCPVLPGRY
jgi:hypothetical protein